MICEKCGSEMWDNRTNKKNPKGPDYKCKDKNCAHAVWLTAKKDGYVKPNQVMAKTSSPEAIELLKRQNELLAKILSALTKDKTNIEPEELKPDSDVQW